MSKYTIGIDLGGTTMTAGLVNENYEIVAKTTWATRLPRPAEDLEKALADLCRTVAKENKVDFADVNYVGIGTPGSVNFKTGFVGFNTNFGYYDWNLGPDMEKMLGCKVYVENDANAAAYGEYIAGGAKGYNDAVVITLGTGIGGGLVVGGKLYTGFAQSGLEVGHMIIRPNGVLCGCGNRGCWEQYGSATALIRIAQEAMEREPGSVMWELCQGDRFRVDGRISFQAARLGDLSAKKVLHRYLEGLSIGLINLVNILQPEIICLGGGISNAEDDLLLDPLRGLVLAGCFDKSKPPRLERASLGNDAGVVGAAMLYKML